MTRTTQSQLLTAAAVAVKIGAMLKKELQISDTQDFYWTVSKIVLGYIFNETKRFRVFVANRIQKIISYTSKNQWNYVETKSNPADHASRGISVDDKRRSDQWCCGPEFLHRKDEEWCVETICASISEISDDDVEVKKTVVVHLAKDSESILFLFRQ